MQHVGAGLLLSALCTSGWAQNTPAPIETREVPSAPAAPTQATPAHLATPPTGRPAAPPTVPAAPATAQAAPGPAQAVPPAPDAIGPLSTPELIAPDGRSATPQLAGDAPKLGSELDLTREDLWARIRNGFAMPDLQSPLADDKTQWYARQPEYMQRMTERASRYLYFIVEEIERRNMPMELALLPFIESAFNPQALSTAKASGMWQFIPSTGKQYNLKQTMWKDERRSVIDSTRAALDYFERLYGMFGDWHLALASYNWGEGSVSRAIARNQRAGKPTDYQSLNMPAETRWYVPKLQAIKNIVKDPERYGLKLPVIRNEPYFVTITKDRDIDVVTAAKLAEISVDQFRALNPSFNRPVIVGALRPEILLPADKVDVFLKNLENYDRPLSSWMAYRVGATERPAAIAARFGISETDLRSANNIPARTVIRPGSTLLVPRPKHVSEDIPETIAESGDLLVAPDGPALRRGVHVVRKGESMASIARRYRVSTTQLAQWNGGRSSVAAGQRLTIYRAVAPAKAGAQAKGKAASRSTARATSRKATTQKTKSGTRAAAKPAGAKSSSSRR